MTTTRRPIYVAIADDHTMVRQGVASMLNKTGDIQVICEAVNGQELLDILEASPTKPEICILDVSMPVMNGYDALVALKKLYPEIKVLVLTMIDHQGNFFRMLNAGADGYMLKGAEMETLIAAIRFMAEHGFYHNPEMGYLLKFSSRRSKKDDKELSQTDEAFLRLCATELSYKEIASAMGITEKAVEGYRSKLSLRLGVKSRTGLAFYALQTGLVVFGANLH